MTAASRMPVVLALAVLGVSALALALAPLVLAESYSWVEHTTSESGAQGVEGAWLARAGFGLLGLGVLWVAHLRQRSWGQPATVLHIAFGIGMLAAAAFSIRSWEPAAVYDGTEDLLHSIAATVVGFAFAFGVAAVAFGLRYRGLPFRLLDVAAVAASVVLPIGMSIDGSIDGALQRLMFAVAYAWYAKEALRSE